jgi:hypothetical protein
VNGDGKTWAPWQAATYINIKNTATLTPAKSVTIGIDIGDKRAFDVQGDLRCKVLVVNSSEDKSFSCDLINPGTQLTFSVQGVGTYGSVVDPQLISVQVDYDGYSSNNNFDIADCPTTDAFKMLATVRIANTCYQKAQNS